MKKIGKSLLAGLLVVPAVFMCTGCKKGNKNYTSVSEQIAYEQVSPVLLDTQEKSTDATKFTIETDITMTVVGISTTTKSISSIDADAHKYISIIKTADSEDTLMYYDGTTMFSKNVDAISGKASKVKFALDYATEVEGNEDYDVSLNDVLPSIKEGCTLEDFGKSIESNINTLLDYEDIAAAIALLGTPTLSYSGKEYKDGSYGLVINFQFKNENLVVEEQNYNSVYNIEFEYVVKDGELSHIDMNIEYQINGIIALKCNSVSKISYDFRTDLIPSQTELNTYLEGEI